MSALSKLLTKMFKGRDIDADAKKLDMEPTDLHELIDNGLILRKEEVSADLAVKIAQLVGGSAHDILNAQTDDLLENMGVPKKGFKVKTQKVKEAPVKPSRTGSRGPYGKAATFKL
jgi:plasmid maintenance system antidote protein VapI